MSEDLKHALRHVFSLTNPSALAGARWGEASVDMNSPHYSFLSKLHDIISSHRSSQASSFPRRRGKLGWGRSPSQIGRAHV